MKLLEINPKNVFKFSFGSVVAVRHSVGPRPLTDIKAFRPHVETHFWIRKGAVAQRSTGKGSCCTQRERKGKEEQRRPKVSQRHSKQVQTSSLHTPLTCLSPSVNQDEQMLRTGH